MSRLSLKRPAQAGQKGEGKRRAGPSSQAPQSLGIQPAGSSQAGNWAEDFAAEVRQATAHPAEEQQRASSWEWQQQHAADASLPTEPALTQAARLPLNDAQHLDVIPESASEDEGLAAAPAAGPAAHPGQPPPPDDEEARQGLLKVASSLRRRLDAGHLQLEAQRRLVHQKQALAASGEAVLAQHCRASWQQGQRPDAGDQRLGSSSGCADVGVRSLQAECAAGQWWLRAVVARRQAQQPRGSSSKATGSGADTSPCSGLVLLAASTNCSVVCSQQRCAVLQLPSKDGQGSRAGSSAADGATLLELTAALEVQQQGQQDERPLGQMEAENPWVDVFLMQEHIQHASSAAAAAAAPLAAPPASPPVHLGRVHLRWQEWLQGHTRPPLPQSAQPERWRHRSALAAASEQLDLSCLHHIVQEQLGFVPAVQPAGSSEQAGQVYALPGPSEQQGCGMPPATAEVSITQHGSSFAEVELRSRGTRVLGVMEQQLGRGLTAAAAQAGAPADAASLMPSLLSPQHAQQAAVAAGALVSELDASIEWLEVLLKQKLAVGSQQRRQRPDAPSDCWAAEARRRQASALTAMAVTDACMVDLLT
ncbi:hypothetical protein ABPG77_004330 [Micractinium sp. CCAP 211/92]